MGTVLRSLSPDLRPGRSPSLLLTPWHPTLWKTLHRFVLSASLQTSPPSIQIMTSNFPPGLGIRDVPRRHKHNLENYCKGDPTVLEPASHATRTPVFAGGASHLPQPRIPESLCSGLASVRTIGPAESWPQEAWLCHPPLLGRNPQSLLFYLLRPGRSAS